MDERHENGSLDVQNGEEGGSESRDVASPYSSSHLFPGLQTCAAEEQKMVFLIEELFGVGECERADEVSLNGHYVMNVKFEIDKGSLYVASSPIFNPQLIPGINFPYCKEVKAASRATVDFLFGKCII